MPIRFVNDSDFARMRYIATYCFPWLHQAQDKMAAYAQKYIKPEYVLGYYDDADILMAAIQMLPFRIMVGGAPLDMGGIAMVSSMPEGRHGGRIADLLKKSLEVMRERGQAVSMLGPFSFEFYRKYGWEMGFDRMDYVIPIGHLKAFSHKAGNITAVTEQDIDALNDIYTAYAKKHNGCVIRDRILWTDFVLDDPFADEYKKYSYLWHYDNGEPGGYIIYTIRDGKMNIYEMIYKDIKALEGLLWFIHAHEAQIEQVKWSAAVDEQLHVLLPNPRVDMKLTPGMMFRVVDVNKALLERGYPDDIDEEFSIRVTDTSAPWNEGPWRVRIANGRAQIEKTDTASLSCDIQAFSQMFLGYMPAERLAAIGRIEGEASSISAANKTFPPSATFNNNGF